jgi:hypothetical protein
MSPTNMQNQQTTNNKQQNNIQDWLLINLEL